MKRDEAKYAYEEEDTKIVCDDVDNEAATDASSHTIDEMVQSDTFKNDLGEQTIIDGKYKLESRIGDGGMGTVYKCTADGFEKPLAIKLLRSEFVNDAISKKRFESEAMVAKGLSHDNTVALYDFGVEPGGIPYLVMDFAEGENLSEHLKKEGALSLDRFFSLFSQICEVLQYAHDRGVIHRDIKPSNIIVTRSGDQEIVKLVDFGIAKLIPPGTDVSSFNLTLTGDVFGTPKYMSPEQCQGHKLNHTTDIYSLGCVMYEALSGHPVFEGENAVQIIVKHITEKPKRIFKQGKEVSPALQDTILRCLEKDPNKRFKSANDLQTSLAKNANEQGRHTLKPRKKLLIATAITCITVLIPSMFYLVQTLSKEANYKSIDDSTWKMYQKAGKHSHTQKHDVEAEALWRSALAEAEKTFRPDDMRLAETCHDLGELIHIRNRDYAGAEKLFQRCLDIRAKNLSPNDRDMADIYGHLGAVKGRLGKHDESLALLDKAIKTAAHSDKELSLHYEIMKTDQLIFQKKYDDAEAIAKRILAIRTDESLGNENTENISLALEKLGYLYAVQDKYNQAIPLYRRAERIRESIGLTNDYNYRWLVQSIASSYLDEGDLTHAKDYYSKALKAWETTDDTDKLGETYSGLAETVARQENYRLAAQYFTRAVELRQVREKEDPADLANELAKSVYNNMKLDDTKAAVAGLTRLENLAVSRGKKVLKPALNELDDIIDLASKTNNSRVLQTAKNIRSRY